jgi:two-component system, cell cycle response regulator
LAEGHDAAPPPLILIASDQEWAARALDSILGPRGYAVLRANTAGQTLHHARTAEPDLVILAQDLPDSTAADLCRALRGERAVTDSTAILITVSGPASRDVRLAALREGANDIVSLPIDADELALRLDGFIRAKRDADRARDQSLVDLGTGLYNIQGLARRAREIGSEAFRHRMPLACVVLAPDAAEGAAPEAPGRQELEEAVLRLAEVMRRHGRVSDAVGRMGRTEFVVFAPGADAGGAIRLTERLGQAADPGRPTAAPPRLRAGYFAVSDYHATPIEPIDMLLRATMALRLKRTRGSNGWIYAADPPLSAS